MKWQQYVLFYYFNTLNMNFSPVLTVKQYFQTFLKFEVYVLKIFLMIFYINNSFFDFISHPWGFFAVVE